MNAIWIAVAAVSLLGLAFGAILGYASRRFAVEDDPVVEKIDEILPQSQCGQCGYPGCRPYAEAISCNGEKVNHCAPVGEAVWLKIPVFVNVDRRPLVAKPKIRRARGVARIFRNKSGWGPNLVRGGGGGGRVGG
ncbi:RnfABCDGE type electron transport complex subunit B, partial [Escherichia coli]|nr:RnfABCDGE type electron transport complex subunit B [Escherichia coli]